MLQINLNKTKDLKSSKQTSRLSESNRESVIIQSEIKDINSDSEVSRKDKKSLYKIITEITQQNTEANNMLDNNTVKTQIIQIC